MRQTCDAGAAGHPSAADGAVVAPVDVVPPAAVVEAGCNFLNLLPISSATYPARPGQTDQLPAATASPTGDEF